MALQSDREDVREIHMNNLEGTMKKLNEPELKSEMTSMPPLQTIGVLGTDMMLET